MPRSGIFLPIARASKRASPIPSPSYFPLTPTTPTVAGLSVSSRLDRRPPTQNGYTPPTPSVPKLSQPVGPGRAPSPLFRPKARASLPRPESPLRRQQNIQATPAKRPSLGGIAPGSSRYAPSPTPGKLGSTLKAKRDSNSYSGDPGKRPGAVAKSDIRTSIGMRNVSAPGDRSSIDTNSGSARIGTARTSNGSHNSLSVLGSRLGGTSIHGDDELSILKHKVEERDRQLKEQAASLADMEHNLAELQSLMPSNRLEAPGRSKSSGGPEDADATQLRALIREKNEKIALLTGEFDAHRADFRSTIDTLELASTETERVYEKRVEELLQEIRELQDRGEDVESVALQLKQLEELVQELEEGLEDARRGEAEARGEVEFLRGEVERGRSELRREREKAAAALKGAGAAVEGGTGLDGSREVEQRDDEIRGLKAIIHSLSRDSVVSDAGISNLEASGRSTKQPNGNRSSNRRASQQLSEERTAREMLEREIKELRGLVDRKAHRESELEHEIEALQRGGGLSVSNVNGQQPQRKSGTSEKTTTQGRLGFKRDSKGTGALDWGDHSPGAADRPGPLETMHESDVCSSDADGSSTLWCEICETGGHDILTCTNMFGSGVGQGGGGIGIHQQAVSWHGQPGTETDMTNQNHNVNTTHNITPPSAKRTGRDVVVEGLKGLSVVGVSPPPAAAAVGLLSRAKDNTTAMPAAIAISKNDYTTTTTMAGLVAGKVSGVVDPDRWCALCERDGHDSVDCPFDHVDEL